MPLGKQTEPEENKKKHFAINIDGWVVELHGTLHSGLSRSVDRMLDEVQKDVIFGGKVKSVELSDNANLNLDLKIDSHGAKSVQVFMPAVNEDAMFVFTHILQHFYKGGIDLRQICDWCRLLYTDSPDKELFGLRIKRAGLMTEWQAFAAMAVEYLGMPVDAMPFYSDSVKWKKKAERIMDFILEVGNFGHNQRLDFSGMSYMKRKFVSFWGRLRDMLRHFKIFPLDSIRFFGGVLRSGLHAAVRGE